MLGGSNWSRDDIYTNAAVENANAKREQTKCAKQFSWADVALEDREVLEGGVPNLGSAAARIGQAFVVYMGTNGQGQKYIGITMNFARRAAEHAKNGITISPISGLDKVSYFAAKGIEQVMIETQGLGNLLNSINSIAQTNPLYKEAVDVGKQLLNTMCEQ